MHIKLKNPADSLYLASTVEAYNNSFETMNNFIESRPANTDNDQLWLLWKVDFLKIRKKPLYKKYLTQIAKPWKSSSSEHDAPKRNLQENEHMFEKRLNSALELIIIFHFNFIIKWTYGFFISCDNFITYFWRVWIGILIFFVALFIEYSFILYLVSHDTFLNNI